MDVITLRWDSKEALWFASDGEKTETSIFPDYALEYLTGLDLEYEGTSGVVAARMYREATGDYVVVKG